MEPSSTATSLLLAAEAGGTSARSTLASLALVAVFIVVGGFFAAAEIALVNLREGQVKSLADEGKRGRAVAHLLSEPNRFLAAVQVGVTLAGFLSAAFGAARLAAPVAEVLTDAGLSAGLSSNVALVLVTLVISYFSLVFGELAPKRIGLQRSEGTARLVAGPLDRIATLTRPIIWLLSKSTDIVVRLLGGDPGARGEAISNEELRDLVSAHESLTKDERKLIDEVFAAGERQVREVMIPRTEVTFLDAGLGVPRAARTVAEYPHSRYPVVRGSQDDIVGFVHVRDLYAPAGARANAKVSDVLREVHRVPATKKVMPTLSEMRRGGFHLAVVIDEYGGTAGIVTLEDLIEELIGDIRDEYDVDVEPARNPGGELAVDGLDNLDEFEERAGFTLPDGPYETVAGYVMAVLGHVPNVGDAVEVGEHRLTVVALDGRRVERVQVSPLTGEQPPDHGQERDAAAPD